MTIALVTVLMLFAIHGCAEEEAEEVYPSKPITVIVPSSPGGGFDIAARAFVASAGEYFGVPLNIKNVPGAAFTIGATELARSDADGYTLFIAVDSIWFLAPLLMDLEYDYDSVQHIGSIARFPQGISVYGGSEWESFDDLLEYVKENPGEVRFGYSDISQELQITRMIREGGYEFVPVAMDTGSAVFTALAGGHIDVGIGGVAPQIALHDSGNIRLLLTWAVTEEDAVAGVPLVEKDYPEFATYLDPFREAWVSMQAPLGLPEDRLQFIEEQIYEVTQDEGYRAMIRRLEYSPDWSSSEEHLDLIKQNRQILEQLLAAMGLI